MPSRTIPSSKSSSASATRTIPPSRILRGCSANFRGSGSRLTMVATKAPNAKVGVLAELARHARHPLLLVNDSDIVVDPGYLRAVTAPLADPAVGLVTCLYRAEAESCASRSRSPGNCHRIRAERAGGAAAWGWRIRSRFHHGFPRIGAPLVRRLPGHRRLSGRRLPVRPPDPRTGFAHRVCARQWWRPIWAENPGCRPGVTSCAGRARSGCRGPLGYYGYVVTHATVWAIVSFLAGFPWIAAAALGLRLAAGILVGVLVLQDRRVLRNCWLIPARDLFGFAVWVGGACGNHVQWRDRRLRLRSDGRIYQDHFPGTSDRTALPTHVVEIAKKRN